MDATRCLNSTDDELFAAVANGDQTAFSELYDRFAPHVFGRVRSQLADPLRAEEVTREVFLDFWRRAPRIDRSTATVSTWLFTTEHGRPSVS
jgi:RNA polymerase sigma-70 factor (ECF subfamily)